MYDVPLYLHALTVIMGFLGYLCYLCHKCTEEIGLVVDPSRTLPDKTGIGRVRLVVAMVTVQIALWVGKGVGGSGNAEVDEGQVGGALHGISVVVPDSAPVTRKKGNSILRKLSIANRISTKQVKVNKDFLTYVLNKISWYWERYQH